jgi:hypothetical protein
MCAASVAPASLRERQVSLMQAEYLDVLSARATALSSDRVSRRSPR